MTLSRITTTFGAVVLGTVLVASTYGSQAAGSTTPALHARTAVHDRYVAPAPRKLMPNGLPMGLHCDAEMGPAF